MIKNLHKCEKDMYECEKELLRIQQKLKIAIEINLKYTPITLYDIE